MIRGATRRKAVLAALTGSAFAAFGVVVACGASDAAFSGTSSGSSADGGAADSVAPFGDAGASPISANGLVLVHAASFPAFRICFRGSPDEQPIPAADLMPASNLPGLDVGAAIRLAPRAGALGDAYVFREEAIRFLYFPSQAAGPNCGALLNSSSSIERFQVAAGLPNLSTGVHLLVLTGCANDTADPTATVQRCGATWKASTGNLALTNIPVTAFTRPSMTSIPIQLVQLSIDLQERANTQVLGLGFGPLDAGPPTLVAQGVVPFAEAVPDPPAVIDTKAIELSDFATNGVFITLGAQLSDAGVPIDAGDAGPPQVVFSQSLADIQRRSSPRSLPPDWFATASSYVVLSVGEIDPRNPDGGPGDERRGLHFLAVPLTVPDGGSPPVSGDGGDVIPDASASD